MKLILSTLIKLLIPLGQFFSSIGIFLLKNLIGIHTGTIIAKLKGSVIVGSFLGIFFSFSNPLERWLIENEAYLQLVLVSLFMDLLLGVYVHAAKFKDFSLSKMVTGFVTKFFLTAMGLILFEVFKLVFSSNNVELGDYFKVSIALIVVSYPLFSAFGNLSEATNGVFPPVGWMNKLKKFQENTSIAGFNHEETKQVVVLDQDNNENEIPEER